jgi:anti-sigma factor RsiW
MSACTDRELSLHAWLDGELDAANTLALEAHVHACEGCSAELRRLTQLRASLRAPGVRFAAPAALRARVTAQVQPPLAVRRAVAAPRVLFSWGLAAGAALLSALCAWLLLVHWPADVLTDDLVASHVRSLLPGHLTDVSVSDQHVVKPWFNGKVDFAPPVPELGDLGFPLAGGRLDYVDRHLAAVVVYRRRQHVINLFVWRGVPPRLPLGELSRRDGYNVLHWSADGLEFWAVSDVNGAELQRFRSAFAQRSQL